MAKNQFASTWETLNKIAKKQELAVIELQSDCPHHTKESTMPSLIRVRQPQGTAAALGNKDMFKCKHCRKLINVYTITTEEIDAIIEKVDAMCDMIKLSCDLNSERDQKTLRRFAKLQLRVRTMLKPAYEGACKYGMNKKKKRSTNNRNTNESQWRRPVTR